MSGACACVAAPVEGTKPAKKKTKGAPRGRPRAVAVQNTPAQTCAAVDDDEAQDDQAQGKETADYNQAGQGEAGDDAVHEGVVQCEDKGDDGQAAAQRKPNKRRSRADEVARLRAKLRDMYTRERLRKAEERRKRSAEQQKRAQARECRAKNKFIIVREQARPGRMPFAYCHGATGKVSLYVWQQRCMKNGNMFWCPVATDNASADALERAGITLEQANAAIQAGTTDALLRATARFAGADITNSGAGAEAK